MKKRIALLVVLSLVFVIAFAFSVSAAQVTDDGSLTLGDCTIAGLDGVTIPSPTSGLVYTLDDATKTASVSGRGSFAGGDLVFPSSVTYNGTPYKVVRIEKELFKSLSYNIYVPDSITFIAGGNGQGTFGNSTITKVYIGSGLTSIEQETFSGSSGFEVFVCKSKPTYIGQHAFNDNKRSSNGMTEFELDLSHVTRFEDDAFVGANILSIATVEFSPNLEYVGTRAFMSTGVNGSVVIPANCALNYRCFNGTSFEMVVIEVAKGTTRQLPQELFSGASGGLNVVFTGTVEANGDYVFSGNSTSVYMASYNDVEKLATTAAKKGGSERLTSATFYVCSENKSYKAAKDGTVSDNGAGQHAYTLDTVYFAANCTNFEKEAYVCYICGNQNVVSEGTEYGDHVIEEVVKVPSCQSVGYHQYNCTVCDFSETAHFVPSESHSATIEAYKSNGTQYLTVTKSCEFCNEVVEEKEISLVNKCYIEGYGFFDATMEYVSVNADGVLTPSSATFNNAVIYFPSYAMVDGNVVEVKTIQGFNGRSIKAIYVPDTVTRLVGGSNVGCFGNMNMLKHVVVGKGVTTIEQELFSSGGTTLDEFIFKGTITSIGEKAFNVLKQSSSEIPYEFNTALTYVGKQVNINGNILREVRIAKGCDLSAKFAFNNANGLLTVYIEGGDTKETALDLGQEFTSNTGTKYWYIKGYVTVSGQAVLSGQDGSIVYMESTDAIDFFTTAIKAQGYKDRLNKTTFMDCGTGTAWYVAQNADRVASSKAFSHGGVFTETESTCVAAGSIVESCFVCGKTVSSETKDATDHAFDGGVIKSMPTASVSGEIVYTCLICNKKETMEIAPISSAHTCDVTVYYNNGFENKGIEIGVCTVCDCVEEITLAPIFTVLGYSVDEEKTSIYSRYIINSDALKYYEEISGEIEIGFIVAAATDVKNNGIVDENNKLLNSVAGCQVMLNGRDFRHIEVKLFGMTTEPTRNLDFIFAAYVVDNGEISYMQHQEKSSVDVEVDGITLKAISVNAAYED